MQTTHTCMPLHNKVMRVFLTPPSWNRLPHNNKCRLWQVSKTSKFQKSISTLHATPTHIRLVVKTSSKHTNCLCHQSGTFSTQCAFCLDASTDTISKRMCVSWTAVIVLHSFNTTTCTQKFATRTAGVACGKCTGKTQ